MRHNLSGVVLLVCLAASAALGQGLSPTTPAQEYIRLNGSVIAIENAIPAPSATITAPAAGATVSGNNVSVTVNVSGVTTLQLKVNGSPAGTPVSSPSSPAALIFDSTAFADGQYTLTVEGTGPGGPVTSPAVSVTVSNIPAISVSIQSPTAGASVAGIITLSASTSGPVTNVQFQIGGANIGPPVTSGNSTFSTTLDTTTVANGSQTLTAIASRATGSPVTSPPTGITVNNPLPPPTTTFVTNFSSNVVRSDYTGWVGMQFTVGSTPLTVTALGRIYISGTSSHAVKLVLASNHTDVAGGTVSVPLTGGTPQQFQYAALASSVTLAANTTYYLLSYENDGGDSWYESGPVASTGVATVGGPVFGTDNDHLQAFGGSAGKSYVPVNFKYLGSPPAISVSIDNPTQNTTISGASVPVTVTTNGAVASVQLQVDGQNNGSPATSSPFNLTLDTTGVGNGTHQLAAIAFDAAGGSVSSLPVTVTVNNVVPSTAFITNFVKVTTRHDYTGYVGMKITVGATPITVTELGRLYVSGNGSHTLALAEAAGQGPFVAGGSVTLTAGATPDQFQYAALATPVTLAANTSYYVLSHETDGGDSWYDNDTTITGTSVASLNGTVYGSGPGNWTPTVTLAGRSYGPVNFKYQTGAPPAMTISITTPTEGQTISGTSAQLTVSANSVTSVQWQVDGGNLGGPVSSPFSLALDTTTLSNGQHTLTAIASNGSGTPVTSNPVHVTVSNGGSPPSDTAFATISGTAEEKWNFTGFIGMAFTVGPTPITVTQLGRFYLSGNGQHTLKLVQVNGSTKTDVPGGTVTITAGGPQGQFQYAVLAAPVTLAANTQYYVLSHEDNGGDHWYEWIPMTTTNVATTNGPVYGDGTYTMITSIPNKAYGPVNFKYQ